MGIEEDMKFKLGEVVEWPHSSRLDIGVVVNVSEGSNPNCAVRFVALDGIDTCFHIYYTFFEKSFLTAFLISRLKKVEQP